MWRKISIDSELHDKAENLGQLGAELSRIVDTRVQKIEAQRRIESEQPPMANAFALTVFCLEDECLSRAEVS